MRLRHGDETGTARSALNAHIQLRAMALGWLEFNFVFGLTPIWPPKKFLGREIEHNEFTRRATEEATQFGRYESECATLPKIQSIVAELTSVPFFPN